MRINYVAQDKRDILFAAKEMEKWMCQLNTMAWEMAQRCGGDLLSKPRTLQRFTTQPFPPVDTITLKVNSNHAGA